MAKKNKDNDIDIDINSTINTETGDIGSVEDLADTLAKIVVLLSYADAQTKSFFSNVNNVSKVLEKGGVDKFFEKLKVAKDQTDYLFGKASMFNKVSPGSSKPGNTVDSEKKGKSSGKASSDKKDENVKETKIDKIIELLSSITKFAETFGNTKGGRADLDKISRLFTESMMADLENKKLKPAQTQASTRFRNAAAEQKEIDNKTGGQIIRNNQRGLELKFQKAFYESLQRLEAEHPGSYDNFFDLKAQSKIANYKKAQIALENAERRRNRSLYKYGGFDGALRDSFLRLEDRFTYRTGFVGMAARLGGNLANNTKIGKSLLGDKLNGGVEGTGVNLGAVLFGGLGVAVSKAANALSNFSKSCVEAYAEIDKVKANLSVVYGGRLGAERIFSEISEYAIKSPFSVSQTAQQAVLLKQTGVEESDVMKTLKVFGDLAGGKQEVFNHLIENFSKIMANQYITARNMQQFTMAGVPIYKALAKQLGVRPSEVRGMVTNREVTADDVMKALTKLTEKGGSFYNAVDIGSKTYAARSVNLEDTWQLGKAAAAERFGGVVNGWLGIKEDISTQFRAYNEEKLKEEKEKDAVYVAKKIDEIDKQIDEARILGKSDEVINKLIVQKMEVESFSPLAKGEYKGVLSRELEDNENKAFNRVLDVERARELMKELVEISYELNDFRKGIVRNFTGEDISDKKYRANELKETLKRMGVEEKTINDATSFVGINKNRLLYGNVLLNIGNGLWDIVKGDYKNFYRDSGINPFDRETGGKPRVINRIMYGVTGSGGAMGDIVNVPGKNLDEYMSKTSRYTTFAKLDLDSLKYATNMQRVGAAGYVQLPGGSMESLDENSNIYKMLSAINSKIPNGFFRGKFNEDGYFEKGYTIHEKARFEDLADKFLTTSAGNVRKLATKKDSTTKLIEQFDRYYKTTEQYKEEEEVSTQQMIDELKKIYSEMESFDLSPENMFGFMKEKGEVIKDENGNLVQTYNDKFLRADEINAYVERFFKTGDAEQLSFTDENFKESMDTLRNNIDGLGKNIKAVAISATGNENLGKQIEHWMKKAYNSKSTTEVNEAITMMSGLAEKSGSSAFEQLINTMFTNLELNEIDPNKLNRKEQESSIKHAYDTSLSPLLNELTEKYLGVSLFRTLGSSLGNQTGVGLTGIPSTMGYARNELNRSVIENVAYSLMTQAGRSRTSTKDVAKLLVRNSDSFYDSKKQSYINKDGEVVDKNTSGKKMKGFYDISASKDSLEYKALRDGRAGTITSLANVYKTYDENLSKFFSESMSSKESKDQTAQMLTTLALIELNLSEYNSKLGNYKIKDEDMQAYRAAGNNNAKKLSVFNKIRNEGNENGGKFSLDQSELEKLVKEYSKKSDLIASSGSVALAIEQNEAYRNSVTAWTLDITKSSKGIESFTSIYAEAIDKFQQEIHERGLLISTLGDFRQAVEDFNKTIKDINQTSLINNYTLLSDKALEGISGYDNKKTALTKLVNIVGNENYEEVFDKYYEGYSAENILKDLMKRSLNLSSGQFGMEKLIGDMAGGTLFSSDIYKKFSSDFGSVDTLLASFLDPKGEKNGKLINFIGKLTESGYTVSPELADKYKGVDFNYYAGHKTFKSDTEARAALATVLDDVMKNLAEKYGLTYKDEMLKEDALNAIAKEFGDVIVSAFGLNSAQQMSAFEQARTAKMFEAQDRGVSMYGGWTNLYGNNNAREQSALAFLGLKPESDWTSLVGEKYYDSTTGKVDNEELQNLLKSRESIGLSNKGLDITDENGDSLLSIDKIKDAEAEFWNFKKLIDSAGNSLENLAKSMESAFDSAIVDGISNSMVTLGESMRDGVDATDEINKGLRETFTNLLKSIGPQMTQTGLAIAAGAAAEKKWGLVAGGIGLAAAGGFLSYAGGLLSDSDDDKDDEAQKEARLKSLADILSDLIDQAKTDAEYYERNIRHTNALSTDYDVSSRKVNDMILTPSGTFSTHPEDTIMAMKHPEDLMNMGAGKNAGTVVNFQIINQAGDKVRVEEQRTEDEDGNVDIKAVIVAVTSEAIANGEMDGAFAQMQSRQNGVTRNF